MFERTPNLIGNDEELIVFLGGELIGLHLPPHSPTCGVATTHNTVLQQIPTLIFFIRFLFLSSLRFGLCLMIERHKASI